MVQAGHDRYVDNGAGAGVSMTIMPVPNLRAADYRRVTDRDRPSEAVMPSILLFTLCGGLQEAQLASPGLPNGVGSAELVAAAEAGRARWARRCGQWLEDGGLKRRC